MAAPLGYSSFCGTIYSKISRRPLRSFIGALAIEYLTQVLDEETEQPGMSEEGNRRAKENK